MSDQEEEEKLAIKEEERDLKYFVKDWNARQTKLRNISREIQKNEGDLSKWLSAVYDTLEVLFFRIYHMERSLEVKIVYLYQAVVRLCKQHILNVRLLKERKEADGDGLSESDDYMLTSVQKMFEDFVKTFTRKFEDDIHVDKIPLDRLEEVTREITLLRKKATKRAFGETCLKCQKSVVC